MADNPIINPPKEVMQAIGTLVMYALANAASPDEGVCLSCLDMSVGAIPNDTRIGGWKITVQRVERP